MVQRLVAGLHPEPAPDVRMIVLMASASRLRGHLRPRRHVTDCTASNPFFVVRGQVRTPPEGNYILSGITREMTIEVCRQEGIECVEVGVLDTDLARLGEAFVTGTSDEITPVVRSTPMSWATGSQAQSRGGWRKRSGG